MAKVKRNIGPKELGIDLKSGKESELFKWFLACLLFGKPIQQEVAKRTYFEFVKEGLITPQSILDAGWNKLVQVLDAGHYVRYDFSTADKFLNVCMYLMEEYGGRVTNIIKESENKKDLIRRLEEFKGVGVVTVRIFLTKVLPNFYQAMN